MTRALRNKTMFKKRAQSKNKSTLAQSELDLVAETLGELALSKSGSDASDSLFEESRSVGQRKMPNFVKAKLKKIAKFDTALTIDRKDPRSRGNTIKQKKVLEDAVISYLGEGMIFISPTKEIVLINRKVKDLLGYNPKINLHRKPYFEHIAFCLSNGEVIDPEVDPISFAFKTGKEVRVEFTDDYHCLKQDGTLLPITMSVYPLFVDKIIKGVVALFHDATHEKHFDEVKSDFVSIAAHQIRTPLSTSSLYVDLLLSGKAGAITNEQRNFLKEVEFSNRKMADLLTNFLVASKAYLGTLEIDKKSIEIPSLMDDILHELETKIKEKKHELRKIYQKVDNINNDPVLLRIAFQNILSNAIKYTKAKGRITIMINKIRDSIVVAVKDTGCGIPEADQGRVFLKMQRGSNAKKEHPDGSGLGLYITKAIIESCGGSIWFKSKEGKGTSFYVSLPLGK